MVNYGEWHDNITSERSSENYYKKGRNYQQNNDVGKFVFNYELYC